MITIFVRVSVPYFRLLHHVTSYHRTHSFSPCNKEGDENYINKIMYNISIFIFVFVLLSPNAFKTFWVVYYMCLQNVFANGYDGATINVLLKHLLHFNFEIVLNRGGYLKEISELQASHTL